MTQSLQHKTKNTLPILILLISFFSIITGIFFFLPQTHNLFSTLMNKTSTRIQEIFINLAFCFFFLGFSSLAVYLELSNSMIKFFTFLKKESILLKILFTLFIVFYGIYIFYNVNNFLDSDMSSELVLSKLLAKEKKIFSGNWFYSTELRVLNTQIVFSTLFLFFKNFFTVRVVGSIVLLFVCIASFYYFCVQTNLKKYFWYLSIFLLTPLSYNYFYIVLIGTYYFPHITIAFTYTALVFHILKTKGKMKNILLILIFAFSFIVGLGGLRELLILYLPFFVSTALLFYIKKDDKSKEFFFLQFYSLIFACLGVFINIVLVFFNVLHFKNFTRLNYTLPDLQKLFRVTFDFLNFFGYTTGRVFSFATVSNFVCILFVTGLISGIVATVKKINSNKEEFEETQIVVFFIVAALIFILLYFVTDFTYGERYNLPVVIFSIPVLGYTIKNFALGKTKKRILCKVLLIGIICTGLFNYESYSHTEKTKGLRNVTSFLEENGYTEGYTSFWNGNVITELSNGKINMRVFDDESDDTFLDIYEWLLTKENVDTYPTGKIFVLLSESDCKKSFFGTTRQEFLSNINGSKLIYSSESYKIWGFEDFNDFYLANKNLMN